MRAATSHYKVVGKARPTLTVPHQGRQFAPPPPPLHNSKTNRADPGISPAGLNLRHGPSGFTLRRRRLGRHDICISKSLYANCASWSFAVYFLGNAEILEQNLCSSNNADMFHQVPNLAYPPVYDNVTFAVSHSIYDCI